MLSVTYILITILVYTPNPTSGLIRFTNLKCDSLDRKYCEFDYCIIKPVNWTYQYLSLKTSMYSLPINNVSVRASLYKRASGYRPFLYNLTFDACKFLRNRKANKVANYMYQWFEKYSNMNHTCPYYDRDVYVEKLSSQHLNHMFTKLLPFPLGQYLLDTTWLAYNVPKARVRVYVELS